MKFKFSGVIESESKEDAIAWLEDCFLGEENGVREWWIESQFRKEKPPKCKHCGLEVSLLKTSNHIIGCNLESTAQVLRYRAKEREAKELDEIASRIK